MNQQAFIQIWRHLQANMESFFGRTITKDVQRIEYKQRFVALLEMTSESHQNDLDKLAGEANSFIIKL